MSRRSSYCVQQAATACDAARDRDKVGRIELGDRVFLIVSVPDVKPEHVVGEICRFRVAGRELAVIEEAAHHRATREAPADDLMRRLTGRELEIAVLVAQGHANKTIASRLRISEWTVNTYMRRIFDKLCVDSRAAIVFRCASLISASMEPSLIRHGPHVRS